MYLELNHQKIPITVPQLKSILNNNYYEFTTSFNLAKRCWISIRKRDRMHMYTIYTLYVYDISPSNYTELTGCMSACSYSALRWEQLE